MTPGSSRFRTKPHLPIFLAACALLLAGCAQTAAMKVWMPADQDVAGVRRVAVLEFRGQGDSGRIARQELVTQLWQDGYYTLLDPAEAGPITQASAVESGQAPDVATAIDVGRRLGADAVVVGEVIRYRAEDEFRRENRVEAMRGDPRPGADPRDVAGVGFHRDTRLDRDVSVAIAFQMIDVRTGQIRAENRNSYSAGGEMINGQGYLPDKDALLSNLMARCARDIANRLTPRQIVYEVPLASPGFGRASDQIRRGNECAVKGDWATAEVHWNAAVATEPENHAALYSLALAHAARFDYPRAVELLSSAVDKHSIAEYREVLDRLKRQQRDYDAVAAQRGA